MTSLFIIFIVGILACAILDLWQRVLLLTFKVPPSNWAMVGRWVIILSRSRVWLQNDLAQRDPLRNELLVGWSFHYLVAIAYAIFYFILFKQGVVGLTLFDGLIFGLISVIVPWFFFMPALGAGILGIKTPNPSFVCALALIAHAIFGGAIGLFFNLLY